MSATWHRNGDETVPPAQIPDHELAELVSRAASLGIPAWRIRAALGLPPAAAASDEDVRLPH